MPAKSDPLVDTASPFQIDTNDLAGEWVLMSQQTRAVGRREADARHTLDQAKARLAVCRAQLSLRIRKRPGDFDLPESKSPSNDVVDAVIETRSEYGKAVNEVSQAKYVLDLAEADSNAFLTKRKALERLVELLGLDYWSEREPKATGRGREAMEERRHRSAHGDGGIDPNE